MAPVVVAHVGVGVVAKHKGKFTSSQRWAIWTVYGMKCFWCKKALEFADCEVCRVIPESVSKIVLASLVKDYKLGADFSIDEYNNLVASCRSCNKSKSKGAFRPSPALPGWFEAIRKNAERVVVKIQRIDGDQATEASLRQLVEMLERGEISHDDAEKIVAPFLAAVEGKPKASVEFRLSPKVCLSYSPDGLHLHSASEMRYQKMVENIVESGDWKKRSPERLREGPRFGEGRPGG
jgi:hypothetical protein